MKLGLYLLIEIMVGKMRLGYVVTGWSWAVLCLEPCLVLSRAVSWAVPCLEPCYVLSRVQSGVREHNVWEHKCMGTQCMGTMVYGNMVNGNIVELTTLIKLMSKISRFCWLILYVVIWLWKLFIHWGKGSFTLFYWVSPLTVLRYHGIWRQVQETIWSILKIIL